MAKMQNLKKHLIPSSPTITVAAGTQMMPLLLGSWANGAKD
jgi:hypothetical protein